ncbi:hypothetical protein ZWY2020_000979 [Hordeum vulgare]|nr:hypothetical protein ZWY2020_000979 [Hordeum vulgare]
MLLHHLWLGSHYGYYSPLLHHPAFLLLHFKCTAVAEGRLSLSILPIWNIGGEYGCVLQGWSPACCTAGSFNLVVREMIVRQGLFGEGTTYRNSSISRDILSTVLAKSSILSSFSSMDALKIFCELINSLILLSRSEGNLL